MQFNYPFKSDGTGRTARVDDNALHIKQLIEQVLFTTIGERVNRPSFGTRINQLVFAPNSDELATTTALLVQGALQQWLGNLIKVVGVDARAEDSTLNISVTYSLLKELPQQSQVVQFSKRL